ncbi:hypothetical protein BOTNAR_0555g00090 [Botryotinia narcissicola]|uniref:Uncharacterized protein n=1 Tax=Botryotinia narcissicola TaxID=278944 RepID=A0A4Z1HCV3_9HELO|nr:hypothetical protein BOTNAR_0555g00090 [Botryotinia narcissicola]
MNTLNGYYNELMADKQNQDVYSFVVAIVCTRNQSKKRKPSRPSTHPQKDFEHGQDTKEQ